MRLEWILGGVGIWILGVVAAALSRVIADEFKAWSPSFTKWIIRCAVARLPADQRERFKEEWASHIEEDAIPGEIGKILAALEFVLAAVRKSRDIKKSSVVPGSGGYRKNRKLVEAAKKAMPDLFISHSHSAPRSEQLVSEQAEFCQKFSRPPIVPTERSIAAANAALKEILDAHRSAGAGPNRKDEPERSG